QVLGRQRLGDSEPVDELVDTSRTIRQMQDDRQTVWGSQRPQQLTGTREALGMAARSRVDLISHHHMNILASTKTWQPRPARRAAPVGPFRPANDAKRPIPFQRRRTPR